MSPSREAPEDQVDTSDVGGLAEVVPDPLMPVWRRIELIQEFRRTHGDTYVTGLEILTAIALAVGYGWWVLLYFTGGGVSL
ncbi:hypothetical protein DJ82_01555 [Halorubrum sp. Ib24]|uniref:hypothetical protein n=1 Tax=unclassified Halorubrum TaxID=2642239 RepID=UPI000B9943BF|nr:MULTISPECIES: hypothetical protein [unclassified Halorubrum]OYR42729.1 hypothetical protein DJ82_01555 [Halorubrum sp. Ib24]OYR45902.1 hypothetical protein DJ75_06940 [Halorubrum sp. Eb13]OYR48230.1 hypothetical protein DJ74_11305 [Halorubrum sp. Ea8]OYR54278.1 hypothetical protein DJ73_05400 [Halorubrum sp. Ea1]